MPPPSSGAGPRAHLRFPRKPWVRSLQSVLETGSSFIVCCLSLEWQKSIVSASFEGLTSACFLDIYNNNTEKYEQTLYSNGKAISSFSYSE